LNSWKLAIAVETEVNLAFRATIDSTANLPSASITRLIIAIYLLPNPLNGYVFVIGFFLFVIIILTISVVGLFSKYKLRKITSDIGLKRNEIAFLLSWKIKKNIDSLKVENDARRKELYKKEAFSNAIILAEVMNQWKIGNIEFIIELVGKKFELLRNNFKKVVQANIMLADAEKIIFISEFMLFLSAYFLFPTIELIDTMNSWCVSYPEQKVLTKKEKINTFFYSKPRFFRIAFAFIVSVTILLALLSLQLAIGIALGVGVTCFWGAFTGFDKLFGTKQKE
jgi:hypothetical protein